jgi:hypothetical protein
VDAPPSVYRLDVVNGNLTVSTVDNFNTATVSILGTLNYTENFAAADQRPAPVSIPGVNDKSFSKVGPDGTRTSFDIVTFPALTLTYLQLGTIYREMATPDPSGYSHQFVTTVLTDTYTPSSAMPRSGTAAYNGMAYGVMIASPPGETLRTTASFQMTADFAGSTVAGSINNFNFYRFDTGAATSAPAAAAGLSLAFNTSISLSGFSDQVQIAGVNAGRVEGQFAGPAAQEVGGSYQAQTPTLSLSGAFVAKK